MTSIGRVAIISVLLCAPAILVAEPLRPLVTFAERDRGIRFTSTADVAQIHVELFASSGELIFDSGWRDGNVLDWLADQPLASAARCVVATRDIENRVAQREIALKGPATQTDALKVTLLAHDGNDGMIVNTSGDLSFRFGDFLSGKDHEVVRLTSSGDIIMNGVVHANGGIVFEDGTVLHSASGAARFGAPSIPAASPLRMKSGTTTPFPPAYQFVVDTNGVQVGTTNPAFNLTVTGTINTATGYWINSTLFSHANGGTFLGYNAGATMAGGANVGIGEAALSNNSTGYSNAASGWYALAKNTDGNNNTASGYLALYNNTTGSNNTATGYEALYNNQTGTSNVALGYQALGANTASNNSVAIGYGALGTANGGGNNIAIGWNAGGSVTTGSYNIHIGTPGNSADGNTTRIGIGLLTHAAFIDGIRGVATGVQNAIPVYVDSNGQLGTASSSRRFKFDVDDMGTSTNDLMRLRPVKFRYRAAGPGSPLQWGLIAEEVAEVYPELVSHSNDGQVESVMYQFLAPMLLNEVQRDRRRIVEEEARVASLTAKLADLEKRLAKLEGSR